MGTETAASSDGQSPRIAKSLILTLVIVAAFLSTATTARAQSTLVVDDDEHGTPVSCGDTSTAYPTIGAALASASSGDTVLVCPGTYVENVNFGGKTLTLRSTDGPAVTIIDGNATDSVVAFVSGEGSTTTIEGFTIRNGRSGFDTSGFGDGGGIRIQNASPTIRGNIIVDNRACTGVGVSVSFGSPLIEHNTISNNQQAGCSGGIGGGGISVGGASNVRIFENTISGNVLTSADGGGISLFAAGQPVVERNIIVGNSVSGLSPCASGGGIVLFNQSDAVIAGNVIAGNSAGCGGGVYWLVPSGATGPVLTNNTIADNNSPQGSAILADGFDAGAMIINNSIGAAPGQTAVFCGDFNDLNPPIFRFNNVFSPAGLPYGGACTDQTGANGNISEDPQFVDPVSGDYHLQTTSPNVDAGDNSAPSLPAADIDGDARVVDANADGSAVVDIGADEVTTSAGPIAVAIDIAPGSPQNVVNPRAGGPLRVAILSSDVFDATAVSPPSVRFGPSGGLAGRSQTQDVNHDGLVDLVLWVDVRQSGLDCGTKTGTLTGQTNTGQAVQGEDALRLVGCAR
jgi:parallel beta-helix repeat protein